MTIPDQLPELAKNMEHARELKKVYEELHLATMRLCAFLSYTKPEDVIKHIHTAKTEIINENEDTQIVEYFSLWTEDDLRLTPSGNLLRCNYYEGKYADMQTGVDKSYEVSMKDIESYSSTQLSTLTSQLGKFLKPKED
ncbi:MAG: hypothetical protein H6797_05450 [Candidatus Nomurabacteria bacterium]|nr:MAG: hypothetical protein H6797_05450 [Candidatus Nomurabacteria bacterium]